MKISKKIHKAGQLGHSPIPSAQITISIDLPSDNTPEAMQLYADALFDVLKKTLPGGTLDRLLVLMMVMKCRSRRQDERLDQATQANP